MNAKTNTEAGSNEKSTTQEGKTILEDEGSKANTTNKATTAANAKAKESLIKRIKEHRASQVSGDVVKGVALAGGLYAAYLGGVALVGAAKSKFGNTSS
jgi:hypothetical protein